MEEYFNLLKAEFQSYDPALLIGCLVGIIVYVMEVILYSKKRIFHKGKKKLQEAKEKGHTVLAHQVSARYDDEYNSSGGLERVWTASYEYEFRGFKGRKVIVTRGGKPGPTMVLYHDGSKVYTEGEMSKHNRGIFMLIIPIVVAVAVAWLLGYRP